MSAMIKVAVIGCGHWGTHHIRTFRSLPGSEVVAVIDADAKRLARVRTLFSNVACGTAPGKVKAYSAADVVVIATPTATHYPLVKEVLLEGRHVLCEKPLCRTGAEARELIELAKKKKRILMVGHVFLFNAGIIKLKELLDSGELGDLYYLSAMRSNLGPIRSDVNASYDLAAHDISIFNWFLGCQPESVSAVGGIFLQPGIEDVVFASLKYRDNRIAHIQTSWLNPKKVREITIVGSRKMVTWDDLELNTPVAIYDRGAHASQDSREYGEYLRISMWDTDVRLPKIQIREPLWTQDRHFLDAIRKGRLDLSDGPFALGVVKVLEAIDTSLKMGGNAVEVPGA